MLPSLKYLSLQGVHVDWDTLGDCLSTSETGLTWLELAWHCHQVRPSPEQFHKLLSSSPALRNLVLSGSGPYCIPEDPDSNIHHDHVPVQLPHLQSITIGYRTALEGRVALELLDAPNTRELTLEDATYVGDPEIVNAGTLLSYIGTRQLGEAHQSSHRLTAYEEAPAANLGYQATEKSLCHSCTHVKKANESTPAFPLLESVTLRGVKTCPQPLRVFFGALPNLQHLDLTRMSMQAIHALLPSSHDHCLTTDTVHLNCPCPQLDSLSIKGFEQLDVQDVDFIVGCLAIERQNKGACEFREVDIHVDAAAAKMTTTTTTACVPRVGSPNMKVNIISDSSDEEGEDEEDEDGYHYYYEDGLGMNVDPFEPGGAFNDPLFDAYYSSIVR